MKHAAILVAALIATSAPSAWATTTIVNIDARAPGGATVNLAAGKYKLEFIGKADGGAYDAWNAWTFSNPAGETTGCNSEGSGCRTGWLMDMNLDWGQGLGNFDGTDQSFFRDNLPAGARFTTPLAALNGINGPNRLTVSNTVAALAAGRPNGIFTGGILFNLTSGQALRFRVGDNQFDDNVGGMSLRLTQQVVTGGVPEPATWAMMIAGFGMIGGAMRRRQTQIRFAMA